MTSPIKNVPDLEDRGAQPFGSPTSPANPTAATLTATGNYPSRPTNAPQQPGLFEFNVTAAAPVVLTATHTAGYIAGDIIRTRSRASLANNVTIQDATGPTQIAQLGSGSATAYADIVYSGTAWAFDAGGSL